MHREKIVSDVSVAAVQGKQTGCSGVGSHNIKWEIIVDMESIQTALPGGINEGCMQECGVLLGNDKHPACHLSYLELKPSVQI